jgi:hypothetical protein
MSAGLGVLAAAGCAGAFLVEHLCSQPRAWARAAGLTLGTVMSFAAAIVIASLFGNHLAPRMPDTIAMVIWVGVALAPLVAVIRGKRRRARQSSEELAP